MSPSTDPFESLAAPVEPVEPDAAFVRRLRGRLADALGVTGPTLPTIELPGRIPTMTTDTMTTDNMTTDTGSTAGGTATTSTDWTAPAGDRQVVTPYLTVHDAVAALSFYEQAFGARVDVRMVGGDGRVGHAQFSVGPARFFLADEYPEIGVVSPRRLGGTTVTLHLEVDDVDTVFARAVDAGAEASAAPADQPHGARHGTLVDPFGHRWLLSQQIEVLGTEELTDRMATAGFTATTAPPATTGGIWAAVTSEDAPAMIRFLVDVFGFRDQLVVPGDRAGEVVHSQLAWPEGGIVQVATAHREGNEFSERPVGGQSLYVITARPDLVYRRCLDAGVEVIRPPAAPDYDPEGSVFSVRDHEGNLWSFGTYAG